MADHQQNSNSPPAAPGRVSRNASSGNAPAHNLDQLISVEPLVQALEALQFAQRHLHPATISKLATRIAVHAGALAQLHALATQMQTQVPQGLTHAWRALALAIELSQRAVAELHQCDGHRDAMMLAYKALRYVPYALENLYDTAASSAVVDAYFGIPSGDNEVVYAAQASPVSAPLETQTGAITTGVMHWANERGSKGGCSVYVPENYTATRAYPLIVALHGGAGHGRSFLWTWLRDARLRGCIVVSATALGDTWGLMEPHADTHNLHRMVQELRASYHIDAQRMLLTGMSDGGTFTFLSGLSAHSIFTHLAPVAASFHPFMLDMITDVQVHERNIYLSHGVHDWMFPIDVARTAQQTLRAGGAKLEYREIADLAHTYPREENLRILAWLAGALNSSAPSAA